MKQEQNLKQAQIFRFTWVKLTNTPPHIKLPWQLYRSGFQIFRSTCSHFWLTPPHMSLSVPVHCLCKVISKDLLWTSINRYIYLHLKTYWEENKFYFTATCSALAGVYIYREREYCTVRFTPPPSITLKQKLEMVYSFTFYAALYICCHFMYHVIWSWASGQVSHAFLAIANFCQFLYYFIIMLLLLLCITPQHIYVIVVVVVYYTTGTMTTTRFREIDYEVFVK